MLRVLEVDMAAGQLNSNKLPYSADDYGRSVPVQGRPEVVLSKLNSQIWTKRSVYDLIEHAGIFTFFYL